MSSGSGSPAPAGISFGVDIGGTKVLGVALDIFDQIVAEARLPTPSEALAVGDGESKWRPGGEVAQAIAEVVAQLDLALGLEGTVPEEAPPVGIGAPGMLDRQGRLRFSPHLPQAHGVDWSSLMAEQLGARSVVIENDATLAVLGEYRLGAARGYRQVVMVTLGTGIGGGLVVDGRVQVGGHGFAGEVGHMVVDPDGPPCPCGRRGCWERYASGGGLGLLAREAALAGNLPGVVARAGGDPEAVRGEDVTAAASTGDRDARRVVEQVGWWVGFGLANLTCVLDPECFVLGGGLVGAGDLLLSATRRAYGELVEGGARRPETAIVSAHFGERAGAVGGALAAREGGIG